MFQNSRVGLHESLATSKSCCGITQAVIHLACVTRRSEVLLVSEQGVWGLPKRVVPMVGTLIMFPNRIITQVLDRDPEQMRGVNPACADTKLLGEHVDSGGLLHFLLRVNISHTPFSQWTYVRTQEQLAEINNIDDVVRMAVTGMLISSPKEQVLQTA